MGILDDIFGDGEEGTSPAASSHNWFRNDEYGAAYAVAVYQEDLAAVRDLVETERDTPRSEFRLIREAMEEADISMQDSIDDLVTDIQEMMDVWERQMEMDPSAVWWPIGADTRFDLYLSHCESRADVEQDPFELPSSMGRVSSFVDRCLAAQESDASLAVVPSEHIPLQSSEKGDEPPAEDL